MDGSGDWDCTRVFKRLVGARLKIEFSYSLMVGGLEDFGELWTMGGVLCAVQGRTLELTF